MPVCHLFGSFFDIVCNEKVMKKSDTWLASLFVCVPFFFYNHYDSQTLTVAVQLVLELCLRQRMMKNPVFRSATEKVSGILF